MITHGARAVNISWYFSCKLFDFQSIELTRTTRDWNFPDPIDIAHFAA